MRTFYADETTLKRVVLKHLIPYGDTRAPQRYMGLHGSFALLSLFATGLGGFDYVAPQRIREVVASLGRTEDVKFSPNNRRVAVAQLWNNKITVHSSSGPSPW